ncbi:MAG TPA: aminotransferase class III-fold pyridoxal phosphate-dependent enzyme, partial [Acidimicrobiales bacterium]|nr:aminotransferase class III-fold pyridoxal phosphate-dependent enzyme [Acidimicrobiales bacterium]
MPSAFLHPFARPATEDFVTIVRGEGASVWDDAGNRYVDALGSLWYCTVGHGRTEIVDAVTAQLRTLDSFHTFDRFTNPAVEQAAETIAALAPIERARVFFTSSGSEAVDSAIKLARIAHHQAGRPERRLVVSRTLAYHGVTYGGMTAQGLPLNKEGFGPGVQGVVQVAHDDLSDAERLFAERGDEVAMVIAEPVIGAGGVHPPVPGYLEGLRRLCDDHGAFLCFDEVICGFGRLGAWWGADRFGVRPDLVTFAKGVTSGYQSLGGVVLGRTLLDPLESDPSFILRHGHTYSGVPAPAAAAVANIEIIRREGLLERAGHVGERLSKGLQELAVAEVRGDGAIWAVRLPEGRTALDVREAMMAAGVIARPLGTDTIAFCPPLVISDDDVDRCVSS